MFVRFLVAALIAAFCAATPILADIEGAEDHPITGRYDGSEITGYSTREFDEVQIWTADNETDTLEGQITEIAYLLPEGVTQVAALRNFVTRLEDQGFTPVYTCRKGGGSDDCVRDLVYGVTRLPEPRMVVDSFNFSYGLYQAANQGRTYIALLVSENNGRTYLQTSIITLDALEIKMVDAEEMNDELTAVGHIALYGIRFDTDSATIKPESAETLNQLAQFLTSAPEREIMIVGHTDNQGSLDYNIDLSTRRAEAVRNYLMDEHGIDGGTMRAAGVGFLAPVATNANEDGRSQNRRVEIVAR